MTAHGGLTGEPEREKFRQFCRLLGAIYHYEYFDQLERLRNDYFYFNPETEGHARFDRATVERAYGDLIDALTKVLHGANFIEIPHNEIERAHREHGIVRINIEAPLDDYREVRFFRRGHHHETVEVSKWFGLRKRSVEFGVYDDVVLLVTMKNAEAVPAKGKKRPRKPKVRPGAVLLKYFRDIASADLNALFPERARGDGNARPAVPRRSGADRRHPDPAQARLDADGVVPGGGVLSGRVQRGEG